jgi:hypothetical protein
MSYSIEGDIRDLKVIVALLVKSANAMTTQERFDYAQQAQAMLANDTSSDKNHSPILGCNRRDEIADHDLF